MTLILAQVLKDKGVSSTELAELMESKGYKLSKGSISNILTGKHSPKVSTLENIADSLGASIAEFFSDSIPEELKAIFERNEDGTYTQIGYLKK